MSLLDGKFKNTFFFWTLNNYVITFEEDSMSKEISILEFSNILFAFLHKINPKPFLLHHEIGERGKGRT
jgi:hypothetical protein